MNICRSAKKSAHNRVVSGKHTVLERGRFGRSSLDVGPDRDSALGFAKLNSLKLGAFSDNVELTIASLDPAVLAAIVVVAALKNHKGAVQGDPTTAGIQYGSRTKNELSTISKVGLFEVIPSAEASNTRIVRTRRANDDGLGLRGNEKKKQHEAARERSKPL